MTDLRASLAIPFGPHARQRVDVFIPARPQPLATVLCVHGGWWSHGRHEDLRPFCLHLAELGFACASIGYRLFAEGARSGTDIVADLVEGAKRALEEVSLDGSSGGSAVMLGSGAGSLAALAAASRLNGEGIARVRGAIACGVTPTLEAWEGCSPAVARALDQFGGANRLEHSPLHLPAKALPPLLLLHGDSDLEVPARLAQRLHARQIEAGEESTVAVLTGVAHQFIEQPFERGGRAAMERIAPWLAEHGREPERERLFTGMGSAGSGAQG
jgi:acetyl esterase/lipase